MANAKIQIEVVYADPQQQVIKRLQVVEKATVLTAIDASGLLAQFPTIDLSTFKVGIFSKIVALDTIVHEGDRLEVYHPLLIDPKQARLARAKKQKQK